MPLLSKFMTRSSTHLSAVMFSAPCFSEACPKSMFGDIFGMQRLLVASLSPVLGTTECLLAGTLLSGWSLFLVIVLVGLWVP